MDDNLNALINDGILSCPACDGDVTVEGDTIKCPSCSKIFPIVNGIPAFDDINNYWCNVPRDVMQTLNKEAEETGDWLSVANKYVKDYLPHIKPLYRGDSRFLWPSDSSSRVLDIGSMWGGVAIPAAKNCKEVVALDKTLETLHLLKIRARQSGMDNIRVVQSKATKLPFKDASFDIVILSGVLEWIGLEGEWIYEEHWHGKTTEKVRYKESPEQMQLMALREACRVLKPGGTLYVAIENRYGIQYFLLYPDDHNNVMLVTFMPRFIADIISRLRGKGPYRTYVYSPDQLTGLLKRAGFKDVKLYGTYPHYIYMEKAYPMEMAGMFKGGTTISMISAIPVLLNRMLRKVIPGSIARATSPSLLAFAYKDGQEKPPRILKLLKDAGVIDDEAGYKAVLSNNRFDDYISANFTIFDSSDKPVYFLKVARDPSISGIHDESRNMDWFMQKTAGMKPLAFSTARNIKTIEADGMLVLVTSYLEVSSVDLWFHYLMDKGLDHFKINLALLRKSISAIEERVYLRKLDAHMPKAIRALAEFQQMTTSGQTSLKDTYLKKIEELKVSGMELTPRSIELLDGFALKLKGMDDMNIQLTAVHGDYDFDNVLTTPDGKTALLDFEHLEEEGTPLFDIATLMLNAPIHKWRSSYSRNMKFSQYLKCYGAQTYIKRWLGDYSKATGIGLDVLRELARFGVVEQNIKKYPEYRDPETYPIYGPRMIEELLETELDI